MMSMSTAAHYPTHVATCLDDGLTIPLVHVPSSTAPCSGPCEGDRATYLILADGGPGWVCEACMAELDWQVRPA